MYMLKTAYFFGISLLFTKDIYIKRTIIYIYIYIYIFCKHQWDPKDVHSFLTLLGSHKGLTMTLQSRNN